MKQIIERGVSHEGNPEKKLLGDLQKKDQILEQEILALEKSDDYSQEKENRNRELKEVEDRYRPLIFLNQKNKAGVDKLISEYDTETQKIKDSFHQSEIYQKIQKLRTDRLENSKKIREIEKNQHNQKQEELRKQLSDLNQKIDDKIADVFGLLDSLQEKYLKSYTDAGVLPVAAMNILEKENPFASREITSFQYSLENLERLQEKIQEYTSREIIDERKIESFTEEFKGYLSYINKL